MVWSQVIVLVNHPSTLGFCFSGRSGGVFNMGFLAIAGRRGGCGLSATGYYCTGDSANGFTAESQRAFRSVTPFKWGIFRHRGYH